MSAPVEAIKSAVNPMSIGKLVLGFIVAAAVADALGLTNWLLFPYTTAKAKFMPAAAAK